MLWGTRYVIDVPTVENKIEEKVRLKKSLEIDQEKKLTKRLLESEELQGAEVGVLLMLALGCEMERLAELITETSKVLIIISKIKLCGSIKV